MLEAVVASYIDRYQLLPAGGEVVVGVSGGADSGSGKGESRASVGWTGRSGRSSVPSKITSVAFSGPGQIIGQ